MKRWLICWFLLFAGGKLSAQESIGICARNVFIRADSITNAGGQPVKEWENCIIGKEVPDFIVVTLAGDTIQLSKLKGQILVINFWFIDCHPCIAELNGLNKLVAHYKGKDVAFLAITWETKQRIYSDFLSHHQLDFKIIPDAGLLVDRLMGSGYPTTYIIDQNRVIQFAWNGGSIDEKAGMIFFKRHSGVFKRYKKLNSEQNPEVCDATKAE